MSVGNGGRHSDEQLRSAWVELAGSATQRGDCPEPDRLWAAVCGELDPRETRSIVDHTATCPTCAEDWRLAREIANQEMPSHGVGNDEIASTSESGEPENARTAGWRVTLVAAAAILFAVIGVRLIDRGNPDRPGPAEYRDVESEAIHSLVAEETLPRGRCRLRWTPQEGARYTVRVSTEDLRMIATAEGIERAEYLIPADKLADLPNGTRLLWQVEAELKDATSVVSPTFSLRLVE